jgi:ATP-dependent protease Clp ATPase subunit
MIGGFGRHNSGRIMKVAIPKEEIEKITSTYRCTEQEAAKAYLTAKEKADEVYAASLDKEFEPRESRIQQMAPAIFTPREIKSHLDKYVIGQEAYKKRLAIAAAYHFPHRPSTTWTLNRQFGSPKRCSG